jgi:hypothetical protein
MGRALTDERSPSDTHGDMEPMEGTIGSGVDVCCKLSWTFRTYPDCLDGMVVESGLYEYWSNARWST